MSDFLIIGAGINGLLTARELAAAGARVTLVDSGAVAREASWAGGGIVSPLYPWRYPPAITALASWAQDFYPGLAAELKESTGLDPEYRHSGLLMLAAEEGEQALRWAADNDKPMESLTAAEIYRREPALAPGFDAALWMPAVASVRNPRLCRALHADLAARSEVTIRERCQVTAFSRQGDRCTAVTIRDGRGAAGLLRADRIVLCAGAWSGSLLAGIGIELAVEPVKGQMLLYRFERPPLTAIVLRAGRYLIPRADGHLLAGSTLEYCGFDKTTSAAAREELSASARSLLPELQNREPVAQWAGLRPGAPQGLPFIGAVPGVENLYVNAGQFRNGLVLAPASARLLADCLLQRSPCVDPAPYRPDRDRELPGQAVS